MYVSYSNVNKALADPVVGVGGNEWPQNIQNTKVFWGSFEVDFFILTEGSILGPSHEIWKQPH